MQHRIIPAIMSGGSGTRLWPASTDAMPKQFHALGGEEALIVATVNRVRGDIGALSFAPPIFLSNARHGALIEKEMAAIGLLPSAIALEPEGRNTAAAAAVAAALAAEIDPDALVLLLPADHVVTDGDAFLAAIERAAPFARDHIVTFGIEPDRPETGYGYIKRGAEMSPGVFRIEKFTEKPKQLKAEEYLQAGGYSWNAGMFFFHPRVLLEEFAAAPGIRDAAIESVQKAKRRGVEIILDPEAFGRAKSEPLDTAVMEKTKRAAVVPCDIGWADIGSWDEIWRISERDNGGNVTFGPVTTSDASNNLLRSHGPKLCVSGVSDVIIIATADAVLVLPRGRSQDVKELRERALKE